MARENPKRGSACCPQLQRKTGPASPRPVSPRPRVPCPVSRVPTQPDRGPTAARPRDGAAQPARYRSFDGKECEGK